MNWELAMQLLVLALIDSTSFGTLVIPVWLMLAPGEVRAGRVVIFLLTVTFMYLLLGLALLAGIDVFADEIESALDSETGRNLQMGLGIALIVTGLVMEPWTAKGKAAKAARRETKRREHGPGRIHRWRGRAMDRTGSVAGLMSLAMLAVVVEIASMVPYLAALGMLGTSGLATVEAWGVLAVYCLVMITPALVLLGLRLGFHERIRPWLERLEAWLTKNAGEVTAWILFLVGLYLVSNAAI